VGLDGDEIVSGRMTPREKLRNVERDPRVLLSVEATSDDDLGLREYLVVHGKARVEEGGAAALLQRPRRRLPRRGRELPAAGHSGPGGYVLRITSERVSGSGPWASHRQQG
jgi:hypothetical protein